MGVSGGILPVAPESDQPWSPVGLFLQYLGGTAQPWSQQSFVLKTKHSTYLTKNWVTESILGRVMVKEIIIMGKVSPSSFQNVAIFISSYNLCLLPHLFFFFKQTCKETKDVSALTKAADFVKAFILGFQVEVSDFMIAEMGSSENTPHECFDRFGHFFCFLS